MNTNLIKSPKQKQNKSKKNSLYLRRGTNIRKAVVKASDDEILSILRKTRRIPPESMPPDAQ